MIEIYYNDCKRSQFQIKLVNYEARAHKPKADRAAGVKLNMPCGPVRAWALMYSLVINHLTIVIWKYTSMQATF